MTMAFDAFGCTDAAVVNWKNTTGADVQLGDVVIIGNFLGVAQALIVNNGQPGPVKVWGFFKVSKAAIATNLGDPLFWDSVNFKVTKTPPAAPYYFGTCLSRQAAGDATCIAMLSPQSSTFPIVSATNNIVAHSGGGQALATPLTTVLNRVVTVAAANDSVLLPPSAAGLQIDIVNAHATNALSVYPAGSDAVNSNGSSGPYSLAAGKRATFSCSGAGVPWHVALSA